VLPHHLVQCATLIALHKHSSKRADSQNIIALLRRRARLEQNHYFSSKNKRLNHYELYQEFYRWNTMLNCRFVKVAGHQATKRALRENP
jgi:hypothetical protein